MSAPRLAVAEGDSVIMDVNGEKQSFVRIKAGSNVRVGKSSVLADPLIGAPFGALFELSADGKALQRVLLPPDDGITRVTDTERDNSSLVDKNDNQKLTQHDIEGLKQSGKAGPGMGGGSEIIEALVSNSATFQGKTEFSQDKYKRRKAKKYITMLTLVRPTARAIAEAYYEKGPERIWNLRHDSVAIILSLANVAAGAKVLVAESCLGILTAAALERMGGHGHLCAAQLERPAPLDAVRLLNLGPEECAPLFSTPVTALLQAQAEGAAGPASTAAEAGAAAAPAPAAAPAGGGAAQPAPAAGQEGCGPAPGGEAMEVDRPAPGPGTDPGAGQEPPSSSAGASTSSAHTGGRPDRTQGTGGGGGGGSSQGPPLTLVPEPERLTMLAASGFSSCIVALPKAHPTAVLDVLWPLLAPSATFVVYSPWPGPLAEAFTHLQASRQAVLLQLQESWLRPYQVLPSRTHPHMTCSGTGGFILSGIKVQVADGKPLGAQLAAAGGSGTEAAGRGGGGGQGRGGGGGRGQGHKHARDAAPQPQQASPAAKKPKA